MLNLWALLCCLMASRAFADVILTGNNFTLSFKSIEANFGRHVNESGEYGTLFLASPLDACSPLANDAIDQTINNPYLLIIRGGCGFETKVRTAQSAGFKAAIIYNDADSNLVAMAGDAAGIHIYAVFVSNSSGLKLQKYVGSTQVQVWLVRSFENSVWSILAISFLSLLAISGVLAVCFFVRRHGVRRHPPPRAARVGGMSRRLVRALPSLAFTSVLEDNCTSETCAICLEDYCVGVKLRVLPCRHKFHSVCVDAWLTSWRAFCPVCKRDVRTGSADPPPSESTPLLASSPASSYLISSVGSSSRAIPTVSYLHSVSNSPRNASSAHLIASNSFGHPSFSPLNSRYMSPYYPSPANGSPSYVWSSSHPLRHSGSAASFSTYASTHSLPEC